MESVPKVITPNAKFSSSANQIKIQTQTIQGTNNTEYKQQITPIKSVQTDDYLSGSGTNLSL